MLSFSQAKIYTKLKKCCKAFGSPSSLIIFIIGFTVKQVQRLYSRFKTLDKRDCGFLTREDLLCIPEVVFYFFYFVFSFLLIQVNINPLGERLIDVIMDDYGENNKLNFKQFIFLLAKFRRGKLKLSTTEFNTRDSKLRFLFDVSHNDENIIDYKFPSRCMTEIMI